MQSDYQRSAEAFLADATNATRCALRNLLLAKSMLAPTTLPVAALVRCRAELRVAKDCIDILLLNLLAQDTASSQTVSAGSESQCCPTDETGAQSTRSGTGMEPTAGPNGPCLCEKEEKSTSSGGGYTNRVTRLADSSGDYGGIAP